MGASETIGFAGPMAAPAAEGLQTLANWQPTTFTLYKRVILPLDGFAFWVRADLLGGSSLLNVPFTLLSLPAGQPMTINPIGYLHVTTDQQQNPDESFALNRVVFTAKQPIEPFEAINQETMWIGQFGKIRFGFDQRRAFSRQAGLWHYSGEAIYPIMETQIIDDLADLDLTSVVLSNSVPIWLTINSIAPIYPAFLLPDNMSPPYIAVNVESTEALAMAPLIDENSSHYQLVKDKVRITTYGLRNDQIMNFIDAVNQFTLDTEQMGIWGDLPVVYDERRTQNELNVLAQKKSIEYTVTYTQANVRDVAREFIKSAIPKVFAQGSAAA